MTTGSTRCLILACGNTLRGDDGVGPWLAEWATERFQASGAISVISRQQWTVELADDVAHSEAVLFIDCSISSDSGSIHTVELHPTSPPHGLATHHMGAPELLALGKELYCSLPRRAILLTIGAASTNLSEELSNEVVSALPKACRYLEEFVMQCVTNKSESF